MARTRTPRFNLWRWSSQDDTQDRSDFDDDNASIEALAAKAAHGAIGARPAAGAAMADSFYLITDAAGGGVVGTLYYCDGATWSAFASKGLADTSYAPATVAAARAYRNASLSIANGAFTAVALDAESFDSGALHDLVTNPSRITVPTDGRYQVNGSVRFTPSAAGTYRASGIYKNGVQVVTTWDAPGGMSLPVGDIVTCAANDYLELRAYQDSGGLLALEPSASTGNYLSVARLGS